MVNPNGSSWVIGAQYDATSGNVCAPTGMSSVTGATSGNLEFNDTNGAVSSWPTTSCAAGSPASWITVALELVVPPSNPSELSQLVWSFVSTGNQDTEENPLNGYRVHIEPALPGNTTTIQMIYPQSAGSPIITDNGSGNTWTADTSCSDGEIATIAAFHSANTSAGTSVVTVNFSAPTAAFVYAVQEWNGILTSSNPYDASACTTAISPTSTSIGNVATAAMTPGTSGDLIVHTVFDEKNPLGFNTDSWYGNPW